MVVLDLKTLAEQKEPEDETPNFTLPLSAVLRLLSALQRNVLVGDGCLDLSDSVDSLKIDLATATSDEQANGAVQGVVSLLERYQTRLAETNLEMAVNFRKVLGLVNESFSYLQAGNEKADGRLKYFEQTLNQATKMDSLVALRRHLSGMLDFVHKEGKRDVAEKDRQMSSMADQLRHAQAESARLRVHLPGRTEAIEVLRELVTKTAAGEAGDTYVTVFVVDSLRALRARHGEEVASTIMEELGRKHVQPLAPEGQLFCWTGSSIVLTWKHSFGSTSSSLLHPAPTTFEHRAFIGTRMATFRMTVRSTSTLVAGDFEDLLATLDLGSREKIA